MVAALMSLFSTLGSEDTTLAQTTNDPVLVGAGDVASCQSPGDGATAKLLDKIRGTVITLGDNAYDTGSRAQFTYCYGRTWGSHKTRTRPTPGNHDYETVRASGYFGYFGSRAGPAGKGYYSYDRGNWHIIALNSNCDGSGPTWPRIERLVPGPTGTIPGLVLEGSAVTILVRPCFGRSSTTTVPT